MKSQLTKQEERALPSVIGKQEFMPTPHMIVWLDTAVQLMSDTVTEIAAACNITPKTWYEWLKNDDFRLWFKTNWDKRLAGESWKLDVIGLRQARKDHKYWQDMQRRVGNLREDNGTVAVQVNNFIKNEKDSYGI